MKPLQRRVANLERQTTKLVGVTRTMVSFTSRGDNGEVVTDVGMIIEDGFQLSRLDGESEDAFIRRFEGELQATQT